MIGLALLAPLSSFAEESGANKKKPNIILQMIWVYRN